MTRVVELRSDTFTRPTPAMRQAMYGAEVGDDVWNEDPTIHRLEARAAELTGKEAAVFVTSGTQGNLVALLSHTQPGDEVILGDSSHIVQHEVAGAAVVGGLQLRMLRNTADGRLVPEDVRAAIRGQDIHEPRTGAIALENTHNAGFGSALTPGEIEEIADIGHGRGIPLHIDGARIFNACVALDIPASELVTSADSVTFCLSKGLGAPVGSLLSGSREFVERARRWRKLLGGGMRQAGVLAAAGLVALEGIDRLAEDHANARLLAEGLAEVPGIAVDPDAVQTNIVYFDISHLPVVPAAFIDELFGRGVRVHGGTTIRAVTSYEVSRGDIEYALDVVREVVPVPALA